MNHNETTYKEPKNSKDNIHYTMCGVCFILLERYFQLGFKVYSCWFVRQGLLPLSLFLLHHVLDFGNMVLL